jgi:hypothetical protein
MNIIGKQALWVLIELRIGFDTEAIQVKDSV